MTWSVSEIKNELSHGKDLFASSLSSPKTAAQPMSLRFLRLNAAQNCSFAITSLLLVKLK